MRRAVVQDGRESAPRARRPLTSGALAAAFILLIVPTAGAADGEQDEVIVLRERGASEADLACRRAHHLEWWLGCAYAILDRSSGERRESAATDDPWSVVEQVGPWDPESDFSARFVSACEEEEAEAERQGGALTEPGRALETHDNATCPCTLPEHRVWMEDCLADIQAILPGMRRWEVLDRLKLDGGLQVGGNLRLVHPRCPMLKVDVELDLLPGVRETSPRDLVKTVGSPYLQYPISD